MAPRLKVFVTTDGLTDYVVAASSKLKALAAWGSHQDLFKTGLAHQTDDADLSAAALARPGEVLKRTAGSREALAKLKSAPPPKPAGPSKAALRRVADLQARLEAADSAHAEALAGLDARQAALEREREQLSERYDVQYAKMTEALRAAKRALA